MSASTISAPTRAGDKPVCAEPQNLALVDAAAAKGAGELGVRDLMFETLCRRCPVIDSCLAFANEHGEHGPWGGKSERERRASGHRHPYTHNLAGVHLPRPQTDSGSAA